MKKVISHNTRDLTIDGIIDQDQLKIGTTGGSVAGIFFDNGKENLPGIRFHKQQPQTVLTSTANNGTLDYYMVDPSATGFDRQWVSGPDNSGHTWRVASYLSGNTHMWVIYRDQNTGDSFQIFGTTGSEVADPWSESGWYEIEGDTTFTTLIQLKETLPATQEWQYSVDGSDWQPIKMESAGLAYEVIDIESSHLDANGIVTIQHNLGVKYPLGIGYTTVPDSIEYVDENTLKLDYSNHTSGEVVPSVIGEVWFLNSAQSMLQQPHDETTYVGDLKFILNPEHRMMCWNGCCDAIVKGYVSSGSNRNTDRFVIKDPTKTGNDRVWQIYTNCEVSGYSELYYNKERHRWEVNDICCADAVGIEYSIEEYSETTPNDDSPGPWAHRWYPTNDGADTEGYDTNPVGYATCIKYVE